MASSSCFASTLLPGATKLLHITALATLAVFVSRLPQILLHLHHSIAFGVPGLWLVYYWLHVWHSAGLTWFGYAILAAGFIAATAHSLTRAIQGLLLSHSLVAMAGGGALAYLGRARS